MKSGCYVAVRNATNQSVLSQIELLNSFIFSVRVSTKENQCIIILYKTPRVGVAINEREECCYEMGMSGLRLRV